MRFALALLMLTSPAAAQGLAGDTSEALLWVPHLKGALTLDLGGETRFPAVLGDAEPAVPEEWLRLSVGYLHYFDGHGRLALGGYLSGGLSTGSDQAPEPNDAHRLDLGVALRSRGINRDFVHGTLGLFAEAGVQFAGEPLPGGPGDELAVRWAGGVEAGMGLLWLLRPYVFGETLFRLGVESVSFGGARHTAVFGGLRLQFDWALRTGADAPLTHEEEAQR
jgi:hypothetical protein